jgi:hypothetical protein
MITWASIEPGTDPPVVAIGADRNEWGLCKQIPGCTIGKDDVWRFPLSWAGYVAMRTIWQHQPLHVYPELEGWADCAWTEVRERYRMRAALDADEPLRSKLVSMDIPGFELSGPQRAAVGYLLRWGHWIYGDPRGNGKTPPLIQSMRILHEGGDLAPALVVCPDSAPLSWQRKLATWAPDLRTVIIAGSAKKRSDAIAALAAGEYDVGIIVWQNVGKHSRLEAYPGQAFTRCDMHGGQMHKTATQCHVCPKALNEIEFKVLIPDEAHRMANPDTQWTRAVWWLAHHAGPDVKGKHPPAPRYVWPTTGTLTVNDVGDLWSIQFAIDPLGFPVKGRHMDLYAIQDFAYANKGKVTIGLNPAYADSFRLVTEPMFSRLDRQIARPGDPLMAAPEFRYPPMTPAQEKAYRQIQKLGLAELADCDLVPDNTAVKFTRMCQLASSMIEIADGEDKYGFTVPKINLVSPSQKVADLLDFLGEEDGQWIVAVNAPDLARMAGEQLTKVGITFTQILGGMNYVQKDDAQQAFNRGDARVIFINNAGGESIDLPGADGIFWMQPDPSFVGREQKTGRGDRRGRPTPLRQVYSLTAGTVEIRLYQLGLDKEERHQDVVRDAAMLRWMMDVQPGEIAGDDSDDDSSANRALAV